MVDNLQQGHKTKVTKDCQQQRASLTDKFLGSQCIKKRFVEEQ